MVFDDPDCVLMFHVSTICSSFHHIFWLFRQRFTHMKVSWNGATPSHHPFKWTCHYKPSIWGYPHDYGTARNNYWPLRTIINHILNICYHHSPYIIPCFFFPIFFPSFFSYVPHHHHSVTIFPISSPWKSPSLGAAEALLPGQDFATATCQAQIRDVTQALSQRCPWVIRMLWEVEKGVFIYLYDSIWGCGKKQYIYIYVYIYISVTIICKNQPYVTDIWGC